MVEPIRNNNESSKPSEPFEIRSKRMKKKNLLDHISLYIWLKDVEIHLVNKK
jgi:hypothetical protein